MRYLALCFVVVFPCVIALACSSSQPSAIEAFAQDYCAYVMPCCGGGDAGAPDPASCQTTVTSWQSFGFDPSLTAACLTAMKQAAGSTAFCTTLGPALAPCDAVFAAVPSSGSVPPGGTCTSYRDCASPPGATAPCVPPTPSPSSPNSPTGTCKQVLRGLAGDSPCSSEQYDGITSSEGAGPVPNVSYSCHDFDGVYCDFATSTCEPFLAVGQACDINGDDCGPYASCQSAGYSEDGGFVSLCTAGLEAGAPCDPTATLLSDVQCDLTTTRCRAATDRCVAFLPSGTPCTTDDECEGACRGGKCVTGVEAQLCVPSGLSP